jgi:hypothetical protein
MLSSNHVQSRIMPLNRVSNETVTELIVGIMTKDLQPITLCEAFIKVEIPLKLF